MKSFFFQYQIFIDRSNDFDCRKPIIYTFLKLLNMGLLRKLKRHAV